MALCPEQLVKGSAVRSTPLCIAALLLTFLTACQNRPHPGFGLSATTSVTVRARVAASADDAEENAAGRVVTSSSDLELTTDGGAAQTVGLRFARLAVPRGATVLSAAVQFKTDEATAQATALTVRAQASVSAAAFAATAKNLSLRPRTAAWVRWSPTAWPTVGGAGAAQRTPNLALLVQEVVTRPDWTSGNALVLIITGTGKRVAEAFDGDPAGAPVLQVVYAEPAPPPNRAPVVAAGADLALTLPETAPLAMGVTDDGLPSGLLTTTWSQTGGPTGVAFADPAARATTATFPEPGVYTLRAAASDGALTASDELTVTVQAAPSPPPAPVDEPGVTVVAAGDIACSPSSAYFNGGSGTGDLCRQASTAEVAEGLGADAVLALGDLQYETGTFENFMGSYDLSWGRLKGITYPVPGNHEYRVPGAAGYYRYFGPRAGDPARGYYSFDLGGWHVVALNSNCAAVGGCTAGSPQERWLRADLAANPARCTLAYWHHPRFSSGKHGDNPATADLWAALTDAGAEFVLGGHDHHYERFAPQSAAGVADPRGLRQFLVGTGGKDHYAVATVKPSSEVREGGTHGVLELKLGAESYTWRFVPAAGGTFTDAGSAACF